MTKLLDQDIETKDVLDWKGVHLFHFAGSSCSQKTRIFLNLKGIAWESHSVNLPKGEQLSPWYLGINPRGLVPTLILDGEVHIESNDIIQLIDQRFPENRLIPEGSEAEIGQLLHHEDDLHLDLRTLTFRYTQQRPKAPKSPEDLQKFREGGSGTVQGKEDPNKAREIRFWENVAEHGITDDAVRVAASRFRETLTDLDERLGDNPYLMGESLTVLDIAWFIYVNRLVVCGYPLDRLHAGLSRWFTALSQRPEFVREVRPSPQVQQAIEANHARQAAEGTTLIDVTGL